MQDQPVVGDRDLFLRDMLHQLLFRFQRGFAVVCQADAVGYAEHMCVDSHCWLVVDDRGYDVCRLAAYAGQLLQLVYIGWYDTVEIGHQHLRHAD